MNNNIFSNKIAYLTFDDGPSIYTDEFINVLNQYRIKGTFFVIGINGEMFPDTIKKIVNDGHQIGNHLYSHDYTIMYEDAGNFINELELTNEMIYYLTNKQNNLFRFPGGSLLVWFH